MPPVGYATVSSAVVPSALPPCNPDLVLFRLRLLADGGSPDLPAIRTDPTDDQLFWFRWITGHQITFLIWHLMGEILDRNAGRETPDRASLARLETYAYGYCAMLLYTGSCPIDLYQSLIRPRMQLQHRSFSGTWASDFVPVRGLFRGRGVARGDAPEAAGLARAVDVHKTIHDGIAALLVPEGRSLLQQTMKETVVRPSERTAILYDNFFMTLRAPVDADGITSQLLRRLDAVASDVAARGLYPRGDGGDERPEELRSTEVARCESRIGHILHEVGEAAATPAELLS
ncbi:hypothetical protein San01_27560 [Streptomyces angustmyceticus]|uniref:L-tyrosine 3-hydroxylase n=2 Tax=Streptomyces angustmyceticus TaxID=285578 RepID=A0A5J4LF41_9ACTN|nr:hypothetical protein San01_27560 [Streptomyces angustmyceticus]